MQDRLDFGMVDMNDHALGPRSDGSSFVVNFGYAHSDAGVLLVRRWAVSHRTIKQKIPVTCATGTFEILVAGVGFEPTTSGL